MVGESDGVPDQQTGSARPRSCERPTLWFCADFFLLVALGNSLCFIALAEWLGHLTAGQEVAVLHPFLYCKKVLGK